METAPRAKQNEQKEAEQKSGKQNQKEAEAERRNKKQNRRNMKKKRRKLKRTGCVADTCMILFSKGEGGLNGSFCSAAYILCSALF
ncbi:hypothetical protein BLNAU_22771 [Blattamonas nauphoetae]|uniref:Uncharacterized protein n=1 Tax=Blattamonas nauphoetae TaxID=2049346 RepID=A0ABQ9WS31_9EUKA|nr:hypothetical protein BLNAU_22771 [Blattamonas nauphoetae]